jgi:arabinoxylan arabinofuranohydrolase
MDSDGSNYLIFGTFNYFIAKLAGDMVHLMEQPQAIKINGLQHKDDKPFLHRRGRRYYLSWGCFYAVGSSPYGPFSYSGSVINTSALANTSFATGGGTQDCHGSFFSLHGQTYFACNDRSHGGNGGFRNSIVAYAHYRTNGSIAPIRIDETGVGEYNVSSASPIVQAGDFFSLRALRKPSSRMRRMIPIDSRWLASGMGAVLPSRACAAALACTLPCGSQMVGMWPATSRSCGTTLSSLSVKSH